MPEPFLALITPLTGGAPGSPSHPIHLPGYPDQGLPGGSGGSPSQPIYHPGHPDHGLPAHPSHPIAGGGGGVAVAARPTRSTTRRIRTRDCLAAAASRCRLT